MSAQVIDSLVISMGLDPAEVRTGIQQIEAHLSAALGIVSQFAAGVDEGFREGAAGAEGLASAAQEAGNALQEAGDKGGEGLDNVSGKAKKAAAEVRTLQTEAKKLGKSLGGKLKGFLTGIAAPVAGMLAAGAVVKGYFSDLGKLDELSRKTSLSMKERASKQKLLAKYSKEDLERYRESNKALDVLGDTLSRAFTPVMAAIVPALTWLARGLENVIKFVQRHKSFVIPMIAGIATILMVALLPALKAAAIAAWAFLAPFLPFIVIATLLALLINSLWVYINGGKSALADFFAIFGTGEEISAALAETWEDLKGIGTALWKGLKAAAQLFFSYFGGAVQPLVNIFKNALKTIKSLFQGNFIEAWEHFKNLWGSVGEYLNAVFTGALNLVKDAFSAGGKAAYDAFTSALSTLKEFIIGLLPDWLKDLLGVDGGRGAAVVVSEAVAGLSETFTDLLPSTDDIKKGLSEAGNTLKDFGGGILDGVGGFFGFGSGDSSPSVSPAMATAGNVDNSSETTVNVGGVVVNATSSDPAGIARETGNELRRMTATGNKGVRQ